MNLKPIATVLQDAGLGVFGVSLFINQMPMDCQEGYLLRNKLVGTPIDHELPGYFKTPFQLIARSKSHERGDEMIDQAREVLTMHDAQVEELLIRRMHAVTLPVVFPLSKGNLLETTCDFDVVFNQ